MGTPFDKYIERLRTQKLGKSASSEFSKGISQLTSTTQYMSNKMSGMRLGNQSASARAAQQQQMQQTLGGQMSQLAGEKMELAAQQEERLDDKLGDLEMQREQYIKQKKAEAKAKKRKLYQTAVQVIGGVAGAALAPFTGGLSMAAGAAIGSGLGQAAGSLIDAGAPQDYDGAVQGASDAFAGYSNFANEKNIKESMQVISNSMGEISKLSSSQMANVIPMLNMMIMNGASASEITNALSGVIGGVKSDIVSTVQAQQKMEETLNYGIGG